MIEDFAIGKRVSFVGDYWFGCHASLLVLEQLQKQTMLVDTMVTAFAVVFYIGEKLQAGAKVDTVLPLTIMTYLESNKVCHKVGCWDINGDSS